MKNVAFIVMALSAFAAMPMVAQSSSGAKQNAGGTEEQAEIRNGVRFVVCSAGGGSVPSPLYAEVKRGEYRQVRIGSRVPSMRLRRDAKQQICFYDQDPSAGKEEEGKGGIRSAGKKEEVIEPVMVVQVPTMMAARVLCILVPNKETPTNPTAFFISEENLPSRGMHLVNMSKYKVRMKVSQKGDFSDSKPREIKPLPEKSRSIGKEFMWSFTERTGDQGMAFALEYQPSAKEPETWKLVRSSRFIYSDRQAQITVLVNDPKGTGVKMLSIQMTD